jgi:two-component system alkaline phosphatase synthesis response regulator PhoP
MNRILVVDDDESILDAISMVLEDADYDVQTTFKGTETHNRVLSYKPDVILLDMLLSGNDGRHIAKVLKADTKTNHIPIIMISAHPNAEASALESGADDFLAKPFEREALLQKVKKVLED